MEDLHGPGRKARSGRTRNLVVLLHGYGANGEDLLSLAEAWDLPDCDFLAPNAPFPCEGVPYGYQWFGLDGDRSTYFSKAVHAGTLIEPYLDAALAERRLAPERLALVGFSQGGMMALHVGLRRKQCPAALVSYSGMLIGAEHLDEITVRPPVLLVHGTEDPIIPFAALGAARQALASAAVPVEFLACPGLQHGINPKGIFAAQAFLERHLAALPAT
ncbi:MAG TPA: alpha/beta fold hydrolase [Dongiaceae bacterium]|jgi:phospholipase/carboxylesterase|nr:alpha/beta fold hydrolase [Dongiaceae bacterium]